MPRDIPVGNGSLLVNFDHQYRLRDLYWPHVGQENHTAGHPHTNEPLSVSPLTWSHATLVLAVEEYLAKLAHLNRCPACGQPTVGVTAEEGLGS